MTVLHIIGRRWRELVAFSLSFRTLENLIFAPAMALMGKWLLGRTVLDSTAIVSFLLSPRGFLALVIAAVTAVSIRLIEHAGLSVIFFEAFEHRRISARDAMRLIGQKMWVLLGVSIRFVGLGLLVALPLLLVIGGFAARLLPRHDVNYYLKLRPPEFIAAVVVIAVVALGVATLLISLVVRWRWVVQKVIFEQRKAGIAFAESARLTRGVRWKLAGVLCGVVVLSIALGLVASVLGNAFSGVVLGIVGRGTASLAVSFGLLLLLQVMISAACTFLGSCVDAGVFTSLYRQRLGEVGGTASVPRSGAVDQFNVSRRIALLAVGLLAFAVSGGWIALQAISAEHKVSIHAHRGVWTHAPENTLGAVRAAIAAGADYIETDVQLSKDGILIIAHDSDFSRLGGVAKKVWDLTYEEIRKIPLGGKSPPEFRNEFTPTFDSLLAETKGKVRVNIELKYYGDHQPDLARKVVESVKKHGMLDQVVIQCLEYEPLLEVRRLAPEVPIGYLLSLNAREPSKLQVDFLSVEQNRVDSAFILKAHRRGQHVYAWTVNTPEEMERLLNLGIDGVITDQSALARKIRDEHLGASTQERAVRRVRAWLAD